MSYFDDASLVMIPSGYKDQKVYSVKPIDGTGDLTFSRGSDIEATRVAANGYIEKAKVNLLLQSNSYTTTWLNQLGGTITGGQSGYDGTSDAWLLNKDTSTFRSVRQVISFSGVTTYSVYAKAGTLSNVALRIDSSAGSLQALYDLSAGTTSSIGGVYIDYGIESIGSGWYRIFVTANISGGSNVHIYVDRDGTTAGNIYLQDAQVNYGLVAQEYQETTTTSVITGITNDMPRLDYSGGASCPSLKLEGSRTNYYPHSEYFGAWTSSDATISSNSLTSPEGLENASLITTNTSNSIHYIQLIATTTNVVAISFFVKNIDANYIQIANPSDVRTYVNFDLLNGEVGTSGSLVSSEKIEPYGNDWYRISATFDNTGFANNYIRVYFAPSASAVFNPTYQPLSNLSYSIYGAQAEAGTYPTSYIPTYGTSATRLADAASDSTFTALPNANFTIFFEVNEWSGSDGNNYQVRFFDASGTRAIQFRNRPEGWRWLIVNDAGGSSYLNTPSYTFTKMACRYNGTNYQLFADGNAVGVPFAASDTGILDYFDSYPIGVMGIKQMLCFPTALSDSDLATLTSL